MHVLHAQGNAKRVLYL